MINQQDHKSDVDVPSSQRSQGPVKKSPKISYPTRQKKTGCFKCYTSCDCIENLFHAAVDLTLVVIGCQYLGDCPLQPMVPVYLLVAGVSGMALTLFKTLDAFTAPVCDFNLYAASLLSCFTGVWFLVGNYVVYGLPRGISVDTAERDYCSPVVYWFALGYVTVVWVVWFVAAILFLYVARCCG